MGIDVPSNEDGSPCAFMNVGGTPTAWRPGEVLIFDDSFIHQVLNNCSRSRAVFQVVVAHPDLAALDDPPALPWDPSAH